MSRIEVLSKEIFYSIQIIIFKLIIISKFLPQNIFKKNNFFSDDDDYDLSKNFKLFDHNLEDDFDDDEEIEEQQIKEKLEKEREQEKAAYIFESLSYYAYIYIKNYFDL